MTTCAAWAAIPTPRWLHKEPGLIRVGTSSLLPGTRGFERDGIFQSDVAMLDPCRDNNSVTRLQLKLVGPADRFQPSLDQRQH